MYGRIPVDYTPMQDLSIDIKMIPQAFGGYHLLLVITCDQTNFTIAVISIEVISPYNHGSSSVRSNLTIHHSNTPFIIWQPIHRPRLLERVYKPICTLHWCGDLWSLLLRTLEIGCK